MQWNLSQIGILAPKGVKECRNRSENLINRKRTNFCIEATPPKNSQRKKIIEKNPSEKKYFWKMPFLKFILKFMKNWDFFRFWKLIFKYIGNFRKFYHFLKKIITFSKIWNFQGFPIFLKKISNYFWDFWQYTTFRVLSPDCLSKLSKKTVL